MHACTAAGRRGDLKSHGNCVAYLQSPAGFAQTADSRPNTVIVTATPIAHFMFTAAAYVFKHKTKNENRFVKIWRSRRCRMSSRRICLCFNYLSEQGTVTHAGLTILTTRVRFRGQNVFEWSVRSGRTTQYMAGATRQLIAPVMARCLCV